MTTNPCKTAITFVRVLDIGVGLFPTSNVPIIGVAIKTEIDHLKQTRWDIRLISIKIMRYIRTVNAYYTLPHKISFSVPHRHSVYAVYTNYTSL